MIIRTLSFLALLVAASTQLSAQAENYRMFEWDLLQLGYASPLSQGYDGGVALGTEVRFNVSDNISAGLNFEVAAFGADRGNDNVDVGVAATYNVTGDYYFVNDRSVRPFAGFGLGVYSGGEISVEIDGPEPTEEEIQGSVGSSLGVSPRLGIELGHFRVSLEYNHTFSNRVPNYIGFTVAPTLFGGLK